MQEAAAAAEGWLRLPDAALNMASVCLAQGQAVAAIQQYNSALRRRDTLQERFTLFCKGSGLRMTIFDLLQLYLPLCRSIMLGAAELLLLLFCARTIVNESLQTCPLCAARFSHGTDARALRYLARACYDDGRHKAARRTLLGATHLFPNDHTLRFNTGLSMQVRCVRALGGRVNACLLVLTQQLSLDHQGTAACTRQLESKPSIRDAVL